MKMQAFLQLSLREQVDLLYREGVYLGKQRKGKQCFLLYQHHSFYIEIRYRKYRHHIAGIRCFDTTAHLDPYLCEIDIEELINLQP